MRKTNEKNNKGFSLVELIVVIAIMIVLVAVLAPVFTKYVEESRRATDVTNANTISETILVAVADDENVTPKAWVEVTDGVVTGLKKVPDVKGDEVEGGKFFYYYNPDENVVKVVIAKDTTTAATPKDKECTGDLTNEKFTEAYKNNGTVPAEEAPSNP